MSADIELRKIETNGIKLHTALAGPPEGELVVLLHGFPEHWRGMEAPMRALAAAGYRVAAPDQRGYGLSDKPQGITNYTLDKLGADILGLIQALGRDKAHIIGHDWGAAVTWWLILTAPERLGKVAVINVPHPLALRRQFLTNPAQLRRSWYMFFFQIPGIPERAFQGPRADKMLKTLAKTATRGAFTPDYLATVKEAWSQPGAPTGMLNWYRAALQRPPKPPADIRVHKPLLILWGVRDIALGRSLAEDSRALCDHATVEYFESATHWLIHDEPERVSARLVAWVQAP